MSDLKAILEKVNAAWDAKDEAVIRQYFHKEYSFKGPMMEINGVDQCIEFMKMCPFEGGNENCEMITEGNTVVQSLDWVVTAPFQARIPMMEVVKFEDGKIKESRMLFDTALFPAEFVAAMEAMRGQAA